MNTTKLREFTGHSEISLKDAITNALFKANHPTNFEVVETRGSHAAGKSCYYQVVLAIYA